MEATNVISREELEKLPHEDLQKVLWELERQRCRDDLKYLLEEVIGCDILDEKLHDEVFAELNTLEEVLDLLIQLPRGHLKSTILIAWVLQQIIRNPEIRIAIVCSVYNLASKLMLDFKNIVAIPKVRELFSDIFWENTNNNTCIWQSDRIIVKRRPGISGYTLRVGSIDGEMTGEHYDIICFDDVQAKQNSQTALQIQNVIDGIKNFKSILEPGGIRLFIGTRWKEDDAYNWLINEVGIRAMIKTCCVNSKGEPCSVLEEYATPIYPGRFSLKVLKEIRKEQGAYFFSCQYENNPLPADTVTFKETWIKTYSQQPPMKKIYIMIDPALTKKRGSDESVICVVGQPVEKTMPLHVIKSEGLSFDQTQGEVGTLIDRIFATYLFYRATADVVIGIETNAFQHVLKQWIEKEQKARKVFFEITELKTQNRPKEVRIKSLQPLFENHGIVFNEFGTEKLISQILKFGAIAHDDHPDALAYLLDVLEDYSVMDIQVISIWGNNSFGMDEDFLDALSTGKLDWRDL